MLAVAFAAPAVALLVPLGRRITCAHWNWITCAHGSLTPMGGDGKVGVWLGLGASIAMSIMHPC